MFIQCLTDDLLKMRFVFLNTCNENIMWHMYIEILRQNYGQLNLKCIYISFSIKEIHL